MNGLLEDFERELVKDPALVDLILSRPDTFPPPPPQSKLVPIRCDEVSVDLGIARAARLAINGIESQIELVN